MATEPGRPTLTKLVLTEVSFLAYPLVVLWLSGDWRWIEGWIFGAWFVALCVGTTVFLYFKDPALLAERSRRPGTGGEKGWDLFVISGIFILFLAWLVVMPLDARRFHWTSDFPIEVKVLGTILLAIGYVFMFRAIADNTFASTLVRIQVERKHRVISTGVYGLVRHPMYLGAVCMLLGAPLLLGSLYGLGIGVLSILLLSGRIIGEEKMLTEELEGYQEYRKKVRYRLIPFVW